MAFTVGLSPSGARLHPGRLRNFSAGIFDGYKGMHVPADDSVKGKAVTIFIAAAFRFFEGKKRRLAIGKNVRQKIKEIY